MQQKNNSRRIRICAVCFALLIMLIAAATYYFACRGTEYRILDDAEIQQMSARSEYSTEAERTLAESALMLVGKVNYFWGGKSYTVGWDDRWGKPAEVTSPGHSTSGTTIPYGLDCSGFVLWCYIQLGADKTETIEKIGVGTWNQWDKSAEIKKSDVRTGDLAFINKYPGSDGNHVGICVGFLKNGEPLIAPLLRNAEQSRCFHMRQRIQILPQAVFGVDCELNGTFQNSAVCRLSIRALSAD